MEQPPLEQHVVVRFLVGMVVIAGMFAGGGVGWQLFVVLPVPGSGVVGTALGSLAVFGVFSVWYSRHNAAWRGEKTGSSDRPDQ